MTKITVLDTETTGLKQEKGAKIIEIALFRFDLETRTLESKLVQRFDPECPIEPGAQEVHGISYGELVGEPKWHHMAADIAAEISKADLTVAHNMGFDGPFIAAELMRVGVPVPDVSAFCTMVNGRWACPDGKQPRLQELCFALGVDYDPAAAHAADYDVLKTADCLFRGIDRGFFVLPQSVLTASRKREEVTA